MEYIYIERIHVVRLFDEINYDIKIDRDNPIGIIIAPNGRGKTTILKMLSFVLNPTYDLYQEIRDIPFSRFECSLSNGKKIILETLPSKDVGQKDKYQLNARGSSRRNIDNETLDSVSDFRYRILPSVNKNDKGVIFSEIEESGNSYWLQSDALTTRDSFGHIISVNPITQTTKFEASLKQYISYNKCCKPILFIGTSRLQSVDVSRNERVHSDTGRMMDPLSRAVAHIANIIQISREKYNMEVSKAKDRLPRLFLESNTKLPDLDVFLHKWISYTNELEKYQRIGLIDRSKEFIKETEIPKVYEEKKEFLNTYLEAFQYTTKSLNEVYKKLSLFKSIFDERNIITHKTVECNSKGIVIYSKGKELTPSQLSSGEKNDFIMLYSLIFKAEKGSTILVDEPEISLHIEWQESYLDHLIEICEMNEMQAIVATHSPNIVSTHYDSLLNMGEQHENN